ncbi:response regulator [Thalassotalea euphylliae]|uniref:response regulator n=1 Tax=Thalassotalea euphylliae TaxID=1655234 RepID=UPI00363D58E2
MFNISKTTKVSKYVLFIGVITFSFAPLLLNFAGVDFTSPTPRLTGSHLSFGEIHHALIEWTAVTLAMCIAVLSIFHFIKNNDISVPFIGISLLCAGAMDAFHTLAATQVVTARSPQEDFIPFTWAISRFFNAGIMLVAVTAVIVLSNNKGSMKKLTQKGRFGLLAKMAIALLCITLYIMYLVASNESLPKTIFPDALITRPFDAIPLALFLCCGIAYWIWYQRQKRVLRFALLLSILPEVMTQLHMVFGSTALYDNHFNIAHFIKVVAYGVILVGVIIDTMLVDYRGYRASDLFTPVGEQSEARVKQSVRGFWSLKYKLPLASFFVAFFVATVVTVTIYYEVNQVLKESSEQALTEKSQVIDTLVQDFVDQHNQTGYVLANAPTIKEYTREFLLGNNILEPFKERVVNVLTLVGQDRKIYDQIVLLSNDSRVLAINRQEGDERLHEFIRSEHFKWHASNESVENNAKLFDSILANGESEKYIVFFQQVKQETQTIAALAIAVKLSSLNRLIATMLHDGEQLYLEDMTGKALYSANNVQLKGEQVALFDAAYTQFKNAHSEYGDIGYVDVGDKTAVVKISQVDFDNIGKYHPYRLVLMQQGGTLFSSIDNMEQRSIVLGLALAILTLGLAIFASQRLIQPLLRMMESIRHYEKTGRVLQLPINTADETGKLAKSFESLLSNVEQHKMSMRLAIEDAETSSAKLQSILNSIVDAVVSIDEQGRVLSFNKSAEDMFGFSEKEVLNKHIGMLLPQPFSNEERDFLKDYFNSRDYKLTNLARDLPAQRKEGEVFPVSLSVAEVNTGESVTYTALIRDNTYSQILESQRKSALKEAKDMAWRLDFALSAPQIGVWEYNNETERVSWDKRMYRLYGYTIDEAPLPELVWMKAVHPDDIKSLQLKIQHSLDTGDDFNHVFRVVHPNKQICYLESHAKTIFEQDGQFKRIVGTSWDITEQRLLHDLKQQALDMAQESLRLKSEFLASMSHEIRTPMNGVLGMLGLLDKTTLDQTQQHYLRLASSSAYSLLNLINDILDFSKVEAGKLDLEAIDFNLLSQLSEVVESFALKAQEKNVELILDTTKISMPMVKGDPTRFRQILNNLIGNALKFTEQGEVTVRGELAIRNEQLIFTCVVKDSGIGIAADKIDSLFDSFTQVDASTTRKYGGTGLGLAIVKQLIGLMGGQIKVESKEGHGSSFFFSLCLAKSDVEHTVLPSRDLQGRNILIVDDNETNINVLAGQLSHWGANVTAALNAKEALNKVRASESPLFDVAILDMQMPEMDGVALGKLLQREPRASITKLIMMTAIGDFNKASYYTELGFSAYFPKPVTPSDLHSALMLALDSEKIIVAESDDTEVVDAEEKPISKSSQSYSAIKILLVEDNRVNQAVVQGVLGNVGAKADVAGNGVEALSALNNDQGTGKYDVVLMDCQMPEMDGYQATKAIRRGEAGEDYKDIPIIAMTANAMKGDEEKCLAAGMSDYMSKPVESEQLYQKLLQWTGKVSSPIERDSDDKNEPKEKTKSKEPINQSWDFDGVLKRVRGNEALINSLIKLFIDESTSQHEALLTAIKEENKEAIVANAHKMKGSARNLGGIALANCSGDIESLAKKNNISDIQKQLNQYEVAYQQFIKDISEYLANAEKSG